MKAWGAVFSSEGAEWQWAHLLAWMMVGAVCIAFSAARRSAVSASSWATACWSPAVPWRSACKLYGKGESGTERSYGQIGERNDQRKLTDSGA